MKFPEHIYAYSCIKTSDSKSTALKTFKQSTAYKNAVKAFQNTYLKIVEEEPYDNLSFQPDATIQFDLMTSTRENMHYKLDRIIDQSKPNNTVIVIFNLNSFGNLDSIKKYYSKFKKKEIGVLFIDYTRESGLNEYSTHDFGFSKRPKDEYNRAFDLIERLTPEDIKSPRGRIGSDYDENFRTAFWLYELFQIPEHMAISMVGMSKNGFHMKADNYEQTREYKQELENMETHFHISDTIKRNRPVPKNFGELMKYERQCGSLEKACIDLKVPIIFPIDYQRLQKKQAGGKSELARCLKLYNRELIDCYESGIATGNDPTTFYKATDFFNECIEKNLFYNL